MNCALFLHPFYPILIQALVHLSPSNPVQTYYHAMAKEIGSEQAAEVLVRKYGFESAIKMMTGN